MQSYILISLCPVKADLRDGTPSVAPGFLSERPRCYIDTTGLLLAEQRGAVVPRSSSFRNCFSVNCLQLRLKTVFGSVSCSDVSSPLWAPDTCSTAICLFPAELLTWLTLSCHWPDVSAWTSVTPTDSPFQNTHIKCLHFTRGFILGRRFPASPEGNVAMNYSHGMRHRYPTSILGVCCARRRLKETK